VSEKRIRIQDRILLGLALAGDLYSDVFEPFSLHLAKIKGILPPNYKASNFYAGVSRLLKTDLVEKVIKNGEIYLRLTSVGKKKFRRDISLRALQKKGWDKRWRLVFYDIAELESQTRRSLREKLLEIGFGQLQESIYISPYPLADDVREFLLASGLGDKVFVAVVERLLAGEEKELVRKIWRLDRINDSYKKLIEEIEKATSEDKGSPKFYRRFRTEFLEIYQNDPLLPKELLPDGWLGGKARMLIGKLPNI